MTWNVRLGGLAFEKGLPESCVAAGKGRQTDLLSPIIAAIEREAPDVLALQELNYDQYVKIYEALGYEGRFFATPGLGKNRYSEDGHEFGLALLSRYRMPKDSKQVWTLPQATKEKTDEKMEDKLTRVLGRGIVDLPDGSSVYVYTTHMTHRSGKGHIAQATRIGTEVSKDLRGAGTKDVDGARRTRPPLATVLLGDTNDAHQVATDILFKTAGFEDVWKASRQDTDGLTSPVGKAPCKNLDRQPDKRIDYIFLRSGSTWITQAAGLAPHPPTSETDHLALWATLGPVIDEFDLPLKSLTGTHGTNTCPPVPPNNVLEPKTRCLSVLDVDLDADDRRDRLLLYTYRPAGSGEDLRYARAVFASGVLSLIQFEALNNEAIPYGVGDVDGVPGDEVFVLAQVGAHTLHLKILSARGTQLVDVSSDASQSGTLQAAPGTVVVVDSAATSGAGIDCSQVGAGGERKLIQLGWSTEGLNRWKWFENEYVWRDKALLLTGRREGVNNGDTTDPRIENYERDTCTRR